MLFSMFILNMIAPLHSVFDSDLTFWTADGLAEGYRFRVLGVEMSGQGTPLTERLVAEETAREFLFCIGFIQ